MFKSGKIALYLYSAWTVHSYVSLNVFSRKRLKIDVFPTFESPSNIILKLKLNFIFLFDFDELFDESK